MNNNFSLAVAVCYDQICKGAIAYSIRQSHNIFQIHFDATPNTLLEALLTPIELEPKETK